jgi:galactokinase
VPAIDRLVELACRVQGVYGARLTGGGFGGAIVAFASSAVAATAADSIISSYVRETGNRGRRLVPQ